MVLHPKVRKSRSPPGPHSGRSPPGPHSPSLPLGYSSAHGGRALSHTAHRRGSTSCARSGCRAPGRRTARNTLPPGPVGQPLWRLRTRPQRSCATGGSRGACASRAAGEMSARTLAAATNMPSVAEANAGKDIGIIRLVDSEGSSAPHNRRERAARADHRAALGPCRQVLRRRLGNGRSGSTAER